MLWDDPDARIIYGTLRSGQKVETEHSIVVFGDVNSGAEVIAGGDIVILGTLRGIAHAGAYDESGGGRVIFSLNLQPTQLRIGLVISRGAGSERVSGERPDLVAKSVGSEVARVDNNMIVVEPYQSRTVWVRRRE
jgi:septum site-determining protein MinC